MNRKTIFRLFAGAASMMLLMANQGGCDGNPTPSGDQRDRQVTEQLQNQAAVQVGWPGITNYTEKRNLKMLYELRDQANLVTYAYYLDFNGKKHKVCPTTSVGYGMPYATQYTNPQKLVGSDYANHPLTTIAQPEPNGLFMPNSADGTWVMCLAPDGKTIKPVYIEPRVIVSPFPMDSID